MEYEPFNTNRVFGNIATQWRKTRDIDKLTSALHEISLQNISFKHCLEIIPMEMNFIPFRARHRIWIQAPVSIPRKCSGPLTLTQLCNENRHMVGKGKTPIECGTDVFSEPVNISKLLNHEATCRRDMRSIYANLISKGDSPIAVSFESIYKRSQQYSRALVKELFEQVTGDIPAHFQLSYQNLTKHGPKRTRSNYMCFSGANELTLQADKLEPFQSHHKINCQVALADSENHVVYAEFWDALPSVQADQYYIYGVILSNTQEQAKIKIMQRELCPCNDRTCLKKNYKNVSKY